MSLSDDTKHIIDAVSAVTVVSTLAAWLPPLAALFSLIWTVLRIWEMVTGQKISDRRKEPRPGSRPRRMSDYDDEDGPE